MQISGTGLVTVTGAAPGTESRVTITATKTNYVPGSGHTTVKSINGAPKTVTFSDITRTVGGFTRQIVGYSGDYQWAATATNTSDPVTVSGTGLVTVTGLGDGVDSDVRLTANRQGYDEGVSTTSGRSFEAPKCRVQRSARADC